MKDPMKSWDVVPKNVPGVGWGGVKVIFFVAPIIALPTIVGRQQPLLGLFRQI